MVEAETNCSSILPPSPSKSGSGKFLHLSIRQVRVALSTLKSKILHNVILQVLYVKGSGNKFIKWS
jgi:hypothetical protein